MAVFEERSAQISAKFGEYTHYIDTKLAEKDALIAECEKKAQDAAASAVPLVDFETFASDLITKIEGAMK